MVWWFGWVYGRPRVIVCAFVCSAYSCVCFPLDVRIICVFSLLYVTQPMLVVYSVHNPFLIRFYCGIHPCVIIYLGIPLWGSPPRISICEASSLMNPILHKKSQIQCGLVILYHSSVTPPLICKIRYEIGD